jgi:hypothetical protein
MKCNTIFITRILMLAGLYFIVICSNGTIAYSQKNTEKFREFKQNGLYHTINFMVNVNAGNEEFMKYQGDYRFDVYHDKFITYLIGNLEYKEGNTDVITNKGFLHGRFIFNNGNLFEPEIFAQMEYNDFLLMKERYLVGGGLRINPLSIASDDSVHKFIAEFGIGMMYEYESVTDSIKPITRYIRSTNFMSLRYTLQNNLNFFSVTYFQPHVKDFADFRLLSENRLSISITKYLAFFVSIMYRFDSDPISSLKNYDFEIANGITLTF